MGFLFQILFFFFLPGSLSGEAVKPVPALHPFYVSVTEISQNAAEKSLEISCKFFVDDFEETLRNAYKTKLDFNNAQEKAAFDKVIPDYVTKHLSLLADGRPVTLSYVGFEREKESVFCYFEVRQVPPVKQLHITNSLLHDFRNEQINIMHVSLNGRRQSAKLDYPARQASFQSNQ